MQLMSLSEPSLRLPRAHSLVRVAHAASRMSSQSGSVRAKRSVKQVLGQGGGWGGQCAKRTPAHPVGEYALGHT